MLRPKFQGPYDVKRAKERESDVNGEPIAAVVWIACRMACPR